MMNWGEEKLKSITMLKVNNTIEEVGAEIGSEIYGEFEGIGEEIKGIEEYAVEMITLVKYLAVCGIILVLMIIIEKVIVGIREIIKGLNWSYRLGSRIIRMLMKMFSKKMNKNLEIVKKQKNRKNSTVTEITTV